MIERPNASELSPEELAELLGVNLDQDPPLTEVERALLYEEKARLHWWLASRGELATPEEKKYDPD